MGPAKGPAASLAVLNHPHTITLTEGPIGHGEIMLKVLRSTAFFAFVSTAVVFSLCFSAISVHAQLGNSGSIEGVVKDASGGVIPGAKVEVSNPVSGFTREATTGADGSFRISNVPFNPYHVVVSAPGFGTSTQDVDVRSTVPT